MPPIKVTIAPFPGSLHVFALLAACLTLCSQVLARDPDITRITSTGPSWNTFTNQDGSGLYHEILANIFTPLGITVTHKYSNSRRGLHMVEKHLADVYTCRPEISDYPTLVMARHPMYVGRFHAIFKRSRVQDWQGQHTLENQTLVWRRGYYKASEFKIPVKVLEVDSGKSALGQIILGRGDFYIDDLTLIQESISRTTLPFDAAEYRIEPVGKREYRPVFNRSDRGRSILQIYENGIERLHRSGTLKQIFIKWQHPYPNYLIQ